MSKVVLMRAFEARPARFERDMERLTLGEYHRIHDLIVTRVPSNGNICEIGCGTGVLLARLAGGERRLVAIDRSEKMVQLAKERTAELNTPVDIRRGTALEMNRLYHHAQFECVIACLVLSEMTPDEQAWVLRECRRILKPGGKLLLADEFLPQNPLRRFLARCLSWPLHMITYLWLHFRSLYTANFWQTIYYCVVEMPLLLLSALVSFPFNHPLRELPVGLPSDMGVVVVRRFRGGLRLLEITRLPEGLCAN